MCAKNYEITCISRFVKAKVYTATLVGYLKFSVKTAITLFRSFKVILILTEKPLCDFLLL